MSPTVIAALVAAQAPSHADCRVNTPDGIAQEFIALTEDGCALVRCSCNTGLTLQVPRTASPEPTVRKAKPKAEEGDGGS